MLAKSAVYAATVAAAGGAFFLLYSRDLLSAPVVAQVRTLIGVSIAVAMVMSLARMALLAGSMSDAVAGMMDSTMLDMILRSGEGMATAIRLVGLILIAVTWRSFPRTSAAAMAGAVLAATSFAWVGHAHVATHDRIALTLLSLHLLSVTFWLGALGPLLVIARGSGSQILGVVAARFGRIAVAVVGVLVAAGVALLSCLLGSLSAIWSTDYGRGIGAKIALVAGLLGLAALNKLHLTPRLVAGDDRAARVLARSLRLEIVVAGLILVATAAATTVWGPAEAA